MVSRGLQGGFGSIAAIAWILVLAAAAAMAAAISAGSSGSAALAGLSTRAGLAAESGLQWGRLQASRGVCLPRATFAGSLPGFPEMTVVVRCAKSQVIDGGQAVSTLLYSATACSAAECPAATPPKLYAERTATAAFWH